MYASSFLAAALAAAPALAKVCTNMTIPVEISARNGIFNLSVPQNNMEATIFTQNFTSIMGGGNLTESSLLGYNTTTGTFNISAKFCTPNNGSGSNPTVQFLTHGIGFDKTYWDIAFNNFNYSYTDVAVDTYGYSTFAIDRLGIGNSSKGDPLSEIQAPAELSAIYELTMMLRAGSLSGVPLADKVVHVGHSFGSGLSYTLASMYPNVTDGLILTGFSMNNSFFPGVFSGFDEKLARLNQPLRFGNVSLAAVESVLSSYLPQISTANVTSIESTAAELNITLADVEQVILTTGILDLAAGYNLNPPMVPQDLPGGWMTWSDAGSNQLGFLYPPNFDPNILTFSEETKFPYAMGEILTLGSAPKMAPMFTGPVQIVTGAEDAIYCGGDCSATGMPNVTSIPAESAMAFPMASAFEAYIQPNTGHAINVHYNATAAYAVIQEFLMSHNLAPSS
ncbi:MAG: hypothetical protein M1827_007187 [Pycnora praestabilis]|nr:MAG: hypothetical protein M1827_007187 [Pycnora praestabilis]